jgi:hypothetical protein
MIEWEWRIVKQIIRNIPRIFMPGFRIITRYGPWSVIEDDRDFCKFADNPVILKGEQYANN